MSDQAPELPPARRRLAETLGRLRRRAGLTGEELGQRLGLSQSSISRIERGRIVPSAADVAAWAATCGAGDDVIEELVERAETAQTEAASWRKQHQGGLHAKQRQIGELEQTATTIRVFQDTVVPGLLQTGEYARRVLALANPTGQDDLGAAVAARLQRQHILFDPGKQLEFLIWEPALRWRPGPPEVLLAQLDRIVSLIGLPHLRIGVIPLQAPTLVTNGFAIFGEDDNALVTVETVTAELQVHDPQDVATYQHHFRDLQQAALPEPQARHLITAIQKELHTHT